jgi:hypothetical protein
MARHGVLLAAFLVQPQLPARTMRPEILDLHFQRRADARERIGEESMRISGVSGMTKVPSRNAVEWKPCLIP